MLVTLVVGASGIWLGARGESSAGGQRQDSVLANYVARPDPFFGWYERSSGRVGRTDYVELLLISQEWKRVTWKHQLYVIRPSTLNRAATHALLVIAGKSWKPEFENPGYRTSLSKSAPVYAELAEALATPVAVLLQVPFQPMFDQLTEDWLIAFTFDRFLETGDSDWPLLLPMVKSAVRAMDAVQGYTSHKWGMNVQSFTVTGASKRGWTTWLTGAVDPRATAIAPMVIDVLNMAPQMKHARATWGGFSHKVEPYTKRGLLDRLDTPEGKKLLSLVDPFSYRDALDQPKLIINGTNDDYWVTDSTNLYWNDLPGEKYLLYVPNDGHSLKDYRRVIGSTLALHQHQAGVQPLPRFTWEFDGDQQRGYSLSVSADPKPEALRVWKTTHPDADLRQATWRPRSVRMRNGTAHYSLRPAGTYQAFFIEAEFRRNRPVPLFLSTTMRVLPPAGASRAPEAAQ